VKKRLAEMSNTDSRTLPADALVIFGVTAGLVHKMLFRALYAMARRGVLNAPVVGVAAPKWSPEQLRKQAMDSITQAGRKSAIGNGKDHTDRYPTTPCLAACRTFPAAVGRASGYNRAINPEGLRR